jgi:multicomponent Na+:H+ antiporter subunit D
MINHALFKSTLFLSGGIIAKVYGTRDLYQIKGVFKRMPMVGLATVLAIFGITGTPIFNGSVSKYFIMSGVEGALSWILVFMSLGTIISFTKYSTMLFGTCEDKEHVKVDKWQQMPVLFCGILCFLGGVFGADFINFLFDLEVSIDTIGYLEKVFVFIGSLAAGILIYRFYVKKSKLLLRIRQIDMGFRAICVATGVFFVVLLLVVRFVYAT